MSLLGQSPLGSIRVIFTAHCVQKETMRRTWKERILSSPWRPWVAIKEIDAPAMYLITPSIEEQYIVCHPAMKEKLLEVLSDGGWYIWKGET